LLQVCEGGHKFHFKAAPSPTSRTMSKAHPPS
jgi:hypothetical protein